MKEGPGALDGRGRRHTRQLASQRRPHRRERAVECDMTRRVLERRPLEKQTNRQVAAQRHRQIACRDAVGPLFDLADDAGPAAKGQQFRAEILFTLAIADFELVERVRDRPERSATRIMVLSDETWKRARPVAALRG